MTAWRKSGRCESGACVEAACAPGAVLVRDSKHPGPVLHIPAGAWAALCARLRQEGR